MRESGESPVFSLRNVVVSYSSKSDRNASPSLVCPALDLYPSPPAFLFGPNGSGKSTLLKVLDGLVEAREGSVHRNFGFIPALGAGKAARDAPFSVYLHQHPYLFAGTVGYNAAFACRAGGQPRKESMARAEKALEIVGLSGYSSRRHRRLSGGEAQRVALARVIASDAKVLLLDEPTASADAGSASLVAFALRNLAAQGRVLIIATHDDALPSLVTPEGNGRILHMDRGRIVSDSMES